MNDIKCRFCLSRKVVEHGVRRNKYVCKQRYLCKRCGRTFVINDGFINKKFPPDIITISLDLWNRGLSLRQIKYHMKQHHNININHVTILNWLRYYGHQVKNYTDKLEPDLKGNWQADELVHYFKKRHNWLWNVMHKEKKYLIASRYSMFRHQLIANKVFSEAKEKGTPNEIQTDGLPDYPGAIKKHYGDDVRHVRHSGLNSKANMNTVERMQNTCRDRLKTTRGFSSIKTAQQLWNCWYVFYNYIRPHMSLGITPAQACGINLDLNGNKWKELIKASVNI